MSAAKLGTESTGSRAGVGVGAQDGAEDAELRCASRRYQRQQPVKRPKLGQWVGVIDAILEEDKSKPPKHRDYRPQPVDRE
jgi:hypothetical protein